MSGIFLILILMFWMIFIIAFSVFLTKSINRNLLRITTQVFIFMTIFPSPIFDEIIGKYQFQELCKSGGNIKYEEKLAYGRTVFSNLESVVNLEKDTPLKITSQIWNYKDVASGEIVLSYKIYYAEGGWLSRFINFNSVSRPYSFNGICGGENFYAVYKMLNLKRSDK